MYFLNGHTNESQLIKLIYKIEKININHHFIYRIQKNLAAFSLNIL